MPGMKNGKPVESRVMMAVLFRPETGHIVHYHRVNIFDPQRQISQAHVEERARQLAAQCGWDVANLETLSVDPERFGKGSRFKVDVKSRSLREVPKSERRTKNSLEPQRE